MKIILILFLLFQSVTTFSQTIKSKLLKEKIGALTCENVMQINLTNNDTSYYFFCSFQNTEYQHIIDIGSIMISRKNKLTTTINQLNQCLKYMETGKVDFSIGPFILYDFAKVLYIYDDNKKTTISKKSVIKLINFLERCKLDY
tara:strand:- start:121 stop:552 length:432 start_codon:yes stop_codon:yes gene_type:complete